MAQELRRRYREYYYPREVDKFKQERGWRENEPTQSRVNGRNSALRASGVRVGTGPRRDIVLA